MKRIRRRIASGMLLTLFLASCLSLKLDIHTANAMGTIHIRSDGSIDPSSTPIRRNGNVFSLTGDIESAATGISIERNDIVLDGAGYKIQGSNETGIIAFEKTNITIKNMKISNFFDGIYLHSCSNCNITQNEITDNNDHGIVLCSSHNNTVTQNTASTNHCYGILIYVSSKNNNVTHNSVKANQAYGIVMDGQWGSCSDNNIESNQIVDGNIGIYIGLSYSNAIFDNNVANNNLGIWLDSSSDNKIFHNNITSNQQQTTIAGIGGSNHWDDGYPSGGNRWSDYEGTDFFSGPEQNETGSDGIGDTPYIINEGNVDHYPIMPSATACAPTRIIALPAYSRVSVLCTYMVGIQIEPVRNVWSLEITIQFNSTVASALEVTDRGFLNQPCATGSIIDNSRGIVHFESSETEPAEPKTTDMFPSGLCRILFEASKPGINYINLEVMFYDKNGNLIPTAVQNATVSHEIPSEYILAPSFSDYSPSGMPDFDQTQQGWGGYCSPTSTANALWWIDSRCEALWNYPSGPPSLKSDTCPLVTSYNSSFWDDHDARNVPFLVEELAFLMDTNGLRTGLSRVGCADFEAGLAQYLQIHGVNPVGDADGNGVVEEKDMTIVQEALGSTLGSIKWDLSADLNQDNRIDDADLKNVETHMGERGMISIAPMNSYSFEEIAEIFRKGDAVLLFLDLFLDQEYFGGHAVTLAGICLDTHEVVVHDPHADAYESNRSLGVAASFHVHPSGEPGATLHNDPCYVSNDAFVVENDSAGCFLSGYTGSYIDDYTGKIVSAPPAKWRIWGYSIKYIPWEEHDVALFRVQPSRTIVAKESVTHINVTIANQGRNAEKCRLTVQANTTTIAVLDDLTLESQTIKTVTLTCSTSSLVNGNYATSAYVAPVKDETDTDDNLLASFDITVAITGDINADGKVNILDVSGAATAYQTRLGDQKWNANADMDENGLINIIDITAVAKEYGKVA